MHVRCGITSIAVLCLIRSTNSCVRSRVPPPAPYVTLTHAGCNGCNSAIALNRSSANASVFGGKNSNENVVERALKMSLMCMANVPARETTRNPSPYRPDRAFPTEAIDDSTSSVYPDKRMIRKSSQSACTPAPRIGLFSDTQGDPRCREARVSPPLLL